ncbi:uncharacterized protein MONBRDRAFT_33707 [Monosiga brevicollis MX1]|uniref:Serine/threonine-protein phosphatase 2A activator n=1 Tax=Monosiga brevicollis TaxID=81824 RepID=A9V701_MONBE|nr:uncharacterized protein MONBRDRAFT_33707 [Monosiga brevicollis MX1]EDQ86635.1 predicted protein [Monosiga brevicollis MX1]|eukprot:XP_001748471.1 hypothetical protein [Monosiga brevicollis MX1]
MLPEKRISSPDDVERFKSTSAYKKLVSFVQTLAHDVEGSTIQDVGPGSEAVQRIVQAIERLNALIDETPPAEQRARFGNPAFKDWFAKMKELVPELVDSIVGAANQGHVEELSLYLSESFGNATRIDYGSGHELNFVAFLCCLALLRVVTPQDGRGLCLVAFNRYLALVRRIQTTYNLEPAGSHGVWGLDDFQFLCYYWGAAQLVGQDDMVTPKAIPDEKAAKAHGEANLFFAALAFIHRTKTGPFHEHSRFLFDMSGAASWSKVYKGLFKMYKDEVLHKFPVIQHFFFGSLLPFEAGSGQSTPVGVAVTTPAPTARPVDPARAAPGEMPLTGFPGRGGPTHFNPDLVRGPPVEMRTGTARVAETGSFR